MKVQLVANLAANGELVLAEHANSYEAPAEVSGMGMTIAMECGMLSWVPSPIKCLHLL